MTTIATAEKILTSSTDSDANVKPRVIFTDAAAIKVGEFIREDGDNTLNLRISIKGGGCSGLKYEFNLDTHIDEEFDIVLIKSVHLPSDPEGKITDVKLVIDYNSFPYLEGATIDFSETVEGGEFIINNPNAKTTCGCGSSFEIN